MKRAILFVLVMVPVIGLLFSVMGQPVALAKGPIELTMVHFGPAPIFETRCTKEYFVKRVNEEAKGALKITVKGGPEIMTPFDQPVGVKKGLVDMCLTSVTFFPSLVPGSDLFRAAEFTPIELRKNGANEFFRGKCEKAGLYYLGNPIPDPERFFWIISKKKMETKADFKGTRIAGSPPFFPFFKGLGMVPQTIKGLKDYFSLMERGVVQAHIAGLGVFLAVGTYEVANYIIDHPFFNSTQAILMNLEKWNSLPKEMQDLLQKIMLEIETTVPPAMTAHVIEDKGKLKKGGIEFYKLSPDMEKWFIATSIDASWKEAETKYPIELVNEYKKYLRR